MIDPDEALRRLHEYAEHLEYGREAADRIAAALAVPDPGGPAAALRTELARSLDARDVDGRDLTALLLADVAGVTALPELLMAAEHDLGYHPYQLNELIDSQIRADRDAARLLLLDMLAGADPDRCRAALRWAEPALRADDVPLLARLATAPDPEIRAMALEIVPGPAVDDRAFAVLTGALADPGAEVRLTAVSRLGRTGRADALGPLTGLVGDPEPRVRARVAYVLGRLGSADAGPALRTLLQDADPRVQGRASEALGQLGGDSAVGALLAGAASADPRQRVQAAKALAAVVDEDTRAETRLRELAADPDPAVRAAVLSGLATVGDITGRWTSLVTGLAADPDVTVRHRVAGTALHLLPYPEEVLNLLARDPKGYVREAAEDALRRRR